MSELSQYLAGPLLDALNHISKAGSENGTTQLRDLIGFIGQWKSGELEDYAFVEQLQAIAQGVFG